MGNHTSVNRDVDKQKIWSRSFIGIFATNMALMSAQYMSNAILSLYASSLGAAAGAVGILMSTFAVSSILFRCISGPIMDTYNRKYVVIIAATVGAISYLGFALSRRIELLFIFRLIQGSGMAFGNACCLAMVAQILPKETYGVGIGYYSLAQVISQSVGTPLGLWLCRIMGFKITFVIAAIIMTIAIIFASQVQLKFVRTKKLKINFSSIIAREAILPSCITFLIMTGFVVVNSFLTLFAEEKNIIGNVGLYFTVSAATMIITRPIVGKLTDKWGIVRVIIPSLFANIISFVLISFADSIWPILIAGLISSFGFGACQPAVQALCMKSVSNERRGSASCTNFIGMDLGHLIGPSIAGFVVQLAGYETMWCVMTVPFFLGMVIVLCYRKQIYYIEESFMGS